MQPDKLLQALAGLRQRIHDRSVENQDRDLGDSAELIKVLERMLAGKAPKQAFGAPGDWGYETPIGHGVLSMLQGKD